jgi:hypothetical protein
MSEPRDSNGLSVIHLFEVMLLAMERRLVEKMDDNSRLASERWAKHDLELEQNSKRITDRFVMIETQLGLHLAQVRDRKLIVDARSQPIRKALGWLWDHWRDVVLLAIGLFALLAAITEVIAKVQP